LTAEAEGTDHYVLAMGSIGAVEWRRHHTL